MTASRLLIINVQHGFITEATAHVPARVESLQDSFDEVIVSRFYNPQKSLFRRLVGEDRFALGSTETQLAFRPRDGAVLIDVSSYSCITPPLLDKLRRSNTSRVHLCGIATEAAVLACAIDLFEAGIEPVVLAHASGSNDSAQLHQAALDILRHTIGKRQVIGS